MDTKLCPYCAEEIKAAALACRFCGRDVRPRERLRWRDFPLILFVVLLPAFGFAWGGYLALDAHRRPRGAALLIIAALASGAWLLLATLP